MAKEQALQFIIRVNTNQILQTKFQAAAQDGLAGLVKIGKEAGFDFNADEMRAIADEQSELAASELSDEALESVAGGVNGDGLHTPRPSLPGNMPMHPAIIAILIGL
jgi:predicted ribosomally synthesized peptide with nif11-like leader